MEELFKIDFHVHTIYSGDSIITPKLLVKASLKSGLNGVAITDHNTTKGIQKVKDFLKNADLTIIDGIEIQTRVGDIIGLFINEELSSIDPYEVCDKIHEQGGLVILPHPFRKRGLQNLSNELLKKIDLIEVLNARSSKESNQRALIFSRSSNIMPIAGSDAHTPFEVGRAHVKFTMQITSENEIKSLLRTGEFQIGGSETPQHLQILSRGISAYKNKGLTGLIRAGTKKILGRD
ncbi:putative metal-dependent phosphoesterases {PHP family} [Geoglobus ahangari]|uniref:Putative metal-dependent phosphoesterases (PHP family) n=1 Tax=Geoglobus ahangari TaxID=113653 RepID=A0A0F7IJL4_9EURY|nr:PHP domain-containing protein [Geoglobus ahangari]AKG92432.1 putative metal-dependent phosphoesterases {PHP family} [Geoglobus ahangari]